jgi:HlyD family secretion protein
MSKKGKIAIFVGVVIIIAVFIIVNISKSRESSTEITVAEAKKGDITKTVSGSGRVQPELDVKIAARISSEIVKIHVKEGDLVSKGQVLVDLDRQRYEASVEQSESQLMSAQAGLKKAQADFTRVKGLFDRDLSSQADLDAAIATKMSAESQVQQAQAYLKQARDDLSKTRLTSPIDGTVTTLDKEEGEIAVGSQFQADPIMTVSDLNRMEVLAEIDENNVVMISIGDTAKIEVDAIPDTIFMGQVTEIAHTATTRGLGTQEQVTNFEVKIAVLSNAEKLRPGMSSTVDINTETHKDVLCVPIQCVTAREIKSDTVKATAVKASRTKKQSQTNEMDEFEGGPSEDKPESTKEKEMKEVVFAVENGTAKMVPVKTGISDETNIEILLGLSTGQKVVSGSYKALSKTLKDGSKVKEKKELAFRETKKAD